MLTCAIILPALPASAGMMSVLDSLASFIQVTIVISYTALRDRTRIRWWMERFRHTLEKASTHFSATLRATASRPPFSSILIAWPTLRRASAVASARIVVAWASPRATLICSNCRASETKIDDCFVPETQARLCKLVVTNDREPQKKGEMHAFRFKDLCPLRSFGRDLEVHRVDH